MLNLLLRQVVKASMSASTKRQHLHRNATPNPFTGASPYYHRCNYRTFNQSVSGAGKLPTTMPAISTLAKAQLLPRAVAPISPTMTSANFLALDQCKTMKLEPYPSLQLLQPSTSEDVCPAVFGHILENRVVQKLITTEHARQHALMDVGEMLCMVSLGILRTLRKHIPDFSTAPNSKPLTFMDILSERDSSSLSEDIVSDKNKELEDDTVSSFSVGCE